MPLVRLDKMLADMSFGSRNDIKKYISSGKITVDGKVIKKSSIKIDTDKNAVAFNGNPVLYEKYTYIMLNKPQGVVSAVKDCADKTVIDIISPEDRKKGLFPVGRLDKDTEGLLILTNDGTFAHNTLSPKKHVEKKYYAKIKGIVTAEDVEKFRNGITLADGSNYKPANLQILSVSPDTLESEIEVTISEGKYHQVKKMFSAVEKKVFYLKRIQFGGILLDKELKIGEYRKLNKTEMIYINEMR